MVQVKHRHGGSILTRNHPLAGEPQGSLWHIIHHFSGGSVPLQHLPSVTDQAAITSIDVDASKRLLEMWHLIKEHEDQEIPAVARPNDGIWEMLKHEFHGPLYRCLADGDSDQLAAQLRWACQTELTYGLGVSRSGYDALAGGGEGAQMYLFVIWDRLLRLAEALGVVPVENPEQGRYGENLALPLDEVVRGIEAQLACRISRPRVMGLFGISWGNELIDARVPDDVYTAHRVQLMAKGRRIKTVAEIGGGLGGLALQGIRLGVEQWRVFDLPIVSVLQGYFLIRTLGPDQVRLFGEPFTGQRVEVLPYWEFHRQTPVELVVNRDSFPEIQRDQAISYLTTMQNWCVGTNFYSINQEGMALAGRADLRQLLTSQLTNEHTEAFRATRSPYWIRKGYVEEVFEFPKSSLVRG